MDLSGFETFFTDEKPFGPTNATNLIRVDDKFVFKRLLDPHNLIIPRFKSDPSLIIGRRGSGKTSFLVGTSNYQVTEFISTPKTFAEIVGAINAKSESFMFHENVAELWENLFLASVFRASARRFPEPRAEAQILAEYCSKYGLNEEDGVEDWLWRLVKAARDKAKHEMVSSVAAIVAELAGEDFKAARNALFVLLRKNKARAVLLIDSLEQYPVRIASVAHAVAGLLMCVGEFNQRHDCVHLRVCLPAEMYHEFMDLSPNPMKDFSHSITLHWHAKELLSIAANRLKIYLALRYPQLVAGDDEPMERQRAITFLKRYIPEQVINGYGAEEDTIAYILRHTQLMPRHLLRILNSIFSQAHRGGLSTYPVVDAAYVTKGIKSAEIELVEEVCSAFRVRYPHLRKTCEKCIPYLPYRFSEGKLQQVFNRHGKKSLGFDDFDEFKRMLLEAAVIGRVGSSQEDRYCLGYFEYTAAHKLITSSMDDLCLHPIFAEVFQFLRESQSKAVYPFGTDPDSADYRDLV